MSAQGSRLSSYTPRVELIPRAVIAGLFAQGQLVGTGPANIVLPGAGPVITREVVNRIWSDVVKQYPYQSLQLDPTGTGGAFIGASGPEDAVILQPPLIQVRDVVGVAGIDGAARKAAFVFQTVAHHLGGAQPLNLGVKLVYNAPAPGQSSVDFLLSELIKGADDLTALAGGMTFEASVKLVLRGSDVQYTLLVEPLHADVSQLFLDVDAQFAGPVDVQRIADRFTQVEAFVRTQVRSFLERRAEMWGQ